MRHLLEIETKANCPLSKKCRLLLKRLFIRYSAVPMFASINTMDRCRVAYSKHNGKIIAFHICFNEGSGVIQPKCAYDTKYAEYSPGTFDIIEILKYFSDVKKSFCIDTSRGYHGYKVWLGGQPYQNYYLQC